MTKPKTTEPKKTEQKRTNQKKERLLAVVSELPQVAARQVKGEDGNTYNLVTQEEALQKILEGVQELLNRTE